MSLYYIATKSEPIDIEMKDVFVRIKVDNYEPESSPYIAFNTKDLGAKYLEARNMEKNFTLVTLEEVKAKGFEPNVDSGTVVFETEEQIQESLTETAGEYLRKLVQ